MSQQLTLDYSFMPSIPPHPKLTDRQQRVLDALLAASPEGLEAAEAGAIAHEIKQSRWAHSRDDRCQFCPSDGKQILSRLAELGLVDYVRGRRLWYAKAEAQPEPDGFPPDFEGQFGTYNALPIGY
jgi:hypothetical protein